MSVKRFLLILLFGSTVLYAQKGELIFDNDTIAIYESIVSKSSAENLYPHAYKNGLLYTSAHKSNYYRLLFSNGKEKPEKIKISKRFQLGPVSIFKNEIYFTGMSRYMNSNGQPHLTILKGKIDGLKVTKVKELKGLKDGYTYAHANISSDGNTMVLVTNENDVYHLLEFKRNENNEWERGEPIFITQLNFKILNPVFVGDDTIYFSTNMFDGQQSNRQYENINDKMVLVGVERDNVSFNIFKLEKDAMNAWSIPVKVEALSSDFDDLGVQFIDEKSGYLSTYRYDNTNNIFYFELKQ